MSGVKLLDLFLNPEWISSLGSTVVDAADDSAFPGVIAPLLPSLLKKSGLCLFIT